MANKDISYGAWTVLYYLTQLNTERKQEKTLDNLLNLCEEYIQSCNESSTSFADDLYSYGVEAKKYVEECIKNKTSYYTIERKAILIASETEEKQK